MKLATAIIIKITPKNLPKTRYSVHFPGIPKTDDKSNAKKQNTAKTIKLIPITNHSGHFTIFN